MGWYPGVQLTTSCALSFIKYCPCSMIQWHNKKPFITWTGSYHLVILRCCLVDRLCESVLVIGTFEEEKAQDITEIHNQNYTFNLLVGR